MEIFIVYIINNKISFSILICISILLALSLLIISYLFVKQLPNSEKLSTYECGYMPYEDSRNVFFLRFSLIAIFFVIFDIEMLFLIPWCVYIGKINLLGFWSVIDFFFELIIGFFYIWYTNSLDWE